MLMMLLNAGAVLVLVREANDERAIERCILTAFIVVQCALVRVTGRNVIRLQILLATAAASTREWQVLARRDGTNSTLPISTSTSQACYLPATTVARPQKSTHAAQMSKNRPTPEDLC
jgi:hypothetical protein